MIVNHHRLCRKEWLIYSKIIFARLTRKIQVRQVFCKGSIPAVVYNRAKREVLRSSFPSKIKQVM